MPVIDPTHRGSCLDQFSCWVLLGSELINSFGLFWSDNTVLILFGKGDLGRAPTTIYNRFVRWARLGYRRIVSGNLPERVDPPTCKMIDSTQSPPLGSGKRGK